jgi:hypothetical protein
MRITFFLTFVLQREVPQASTKIKEHCADVPDRNLGKDSITVRRIDPVVSKDVDMSHRNPGK